MKNVTISRIEPTNPVLLTYIDKIRSWDKEGTIKLVKDNHIEPFYALYYNATFFGAGTIELDKDNSLAKVALVNGRADYDKIQNITENKFHQLIEKEFGTSDVEFSYVKKRG